jgi:nitric oxide reductase activation protein
MPPQVSEADPGADQGANQQDTDDEGRHCKSGPDPEQGTAAARAALNAGVDDMDMDPFQSLGELLGAGHGPGTPMMLPAAEDFAGDPQVGQALLTKVKAESRKLTARLHGLVQASRLDRDRTVRRGRKLDGKRLHRAAVGDDRIFSRKAERVAVDTAIHLLVDLSGSMNKPVGAQEAFDGLPETRLYHRALEASLALALAFDGIVGVSTAVTAFPGITGQADRLTRVVDHPCQSRVRAGAFVQSPRGNTPMAQAMWYAAADLALRRESRRVMMVLTDGDPDNLDAVQDLVRLCRDAQIEVIGVGIAIDISHLFPVSIRVDAISDLKSALFGTAERLLMQRP